MAIMPGLSSTTWATTVNCELIHVDKWCLLTPAAMVGTGYLRVWVSSLATAARAKKAQTPRLGTGLDALMADQEEEEPKGKKEKRKEEDRSWSPRKRESMSEYLKRQVNQHEEAAASGKKKKDERRRKAGKRKPASSDIQSGEGSDSSSFQLTPARGGSSFGEWPKRKPGN